MRNLHPATASALGAQNVGYSVFEMYVFRSRTEYVWTGAGPYTMPSALAMGMGIPAGTAFLGMGSLGTIGPVEEGSDGKAEGTSSTLSGIDPVILAEAMTDVQQGAPAKRWMVLMTPLMTVIGSPYLWFSGVVDSPPVAVGADQMSITLALETQLANHERASNLKYTSADQRLLYPDDTAFDHVEQLNDIALRINN